MKTSGRGSAGLQLPRYELHLKCWFESCSLYFQVQFTTSGTFLMVSGVLKKNIIRAKIGEVVVFQLVGQDEGEVKSRISLR